VAALEAFCRAYWFPLYAFVRRSGHTPHDAEDLAQQFFYRLLEKHWLEAAAPEKGRLRTFLIVALKNIIAKEWRRVGQLTTLPWPSSSAPALPRLG
jgi:RNA polymerase sigma-70 factor (ECF subfamily)